MSLEKEVTEKELEESTEEDSEQESNEAQAMQAQQAQQQNLYQQAVQYGIHKLVQTRPRLRGLERTLLKHIDQKQLIQEIKGISEYIEKRGSKWSPEQRTQFFEDKLASYTLSGKILDEKGQMYILKTKRAKGISWSESREMRKGEEYADMAVGTVEYIGDALASGAYNDNKLANGVQTLKKINFWYSGVDFLFMQGALDATKYKRLKRAYKARMQQEYELIINQVEEAARGTKVAASILGFLGVGTILLSGANLTGNVVGTIGTPAESALGVLVGLVLIAGSFLFFRKK